MDERKGRHIASSVVIRDATHSVRQCHRSSFKIPYMHTTPHHPFEQSLDESTPLLQVPQEKPLALASAIWEAVQYDKHSILSKL